MLRPQKFQTGIDIVDFQHREILFAVLRLGRLASRNPPRAELEEQIRRILRLAGSHFATEESLMAQHGYPGFGAHMAEHAEMLGRLYGFEERVEQATASLGLFVSTFIRGWLKHHIGSEDKALGAYLRNA